MQETFIRVSKEEVENATQYEGIDAYDNDSDIESLDNALMLCRLESNTTETTTDSFDEQDCQDGGTNASSALSNGHRERSSATRAPTTKGEHGRKDSFGK